MAVRTTTDQEISVTGVVADEDRDGAFRPEAVAAVPVRIDESTQELALDVQVELIVEGCP